MDGAGKGRKALAEVGIQMPEAAKVAVAVDSGTMSGPLVPVTGRPDGAAAAGRRWDIAGAAMRAATVVSSLLALALMVSAEQRGELSLFGFQLPLHSKWSFSDSLEYLVGISAAVAAHSLLQLLLSVRKLVKKAPVIPSRRHGWVIFAGDQVLLFMTCRSSCPSHPFSFKIKNVPGSNHISRLGILSIVGLWVNKRLLHML
ncbi:CASP-like protein 3A1 isoform X2 [Phoenix dactylifera]|uniref:CASP-like protein n=1 Tax=Phoenix dactylifera TaxID=42345 RepID=A0A8B9A3X0_PHODC|nr:CASP-like protein 3A1 isoform X2 [Phoenix dactylifera]